MTLVTFRDIVATESRGCPPDMSDRTIMTIGIGFGIVVPIGVAIFLLIH
jgi:hypothetical protein